MTVLRALRTHARRAARNVAELAGVGALVIGAWSIYAAAGIVVLGLGLIVLANFAEWGERR